MHVTIRGCVLCACRTLCTVTLSIHFTLHSDTSTLTFCPLCHLLPLRRVSAFLLYITNLIDPETKHLSLIALVEKSSLLFANIITIMAMRKCFGFLFLLFIVFFSSQMVVPSEARVCQSQSHGFKGTCVRNQNCALVCKNEGFSGGRCRGLRRRCFCTKLC